MRTELVFKDCIYTASGIFLLELVTFCFRRMSFALHSPLSVVPERVEIKLVYVWTFG